MEIRKFVLGALSTNTYLLIEGKSAILIDPASKAEKLNEILKDLKLEAVLLTHGHFDHIKAVDGLYKEFKMPVYIHEDDEELSRDKESGALFGLSAYISCPLCYLKEGRMNVGPFEIDVVFTPGHTEGSVVFMINKDIFTGDTLFRLSAGRTDLKGGNERKLKNSLKFFKSLDGDYIIHPGHDSESLLSFEKENNVFLR